MKILNFGSLNYDHVYETEHFVEPKETASSLTYHKNLGGKGFNQSVALCRAGLEVYHAGKLGYDGAEMRDYLQKEGVFTAYLLQDDNFATGHAIIEVCHGENRILLHGGANQEIRESDVDFVLSHFEKGDVLVLQNEISGMSYLMQKAGEIGMRIVFNTAPMNDKVFTYPLEKVGMLVVNEVEARALACSSSEEYREILRALKAKYPHAEIVMTLGKDGCYYAYGDQEVYQSAYCVPAVDTTAAGDTFLGYFLASYLRDGEVREALRKACYASSLSVQKPGAAQSIPFLHEVK